MNEQLVDLNDSSARVGRPCNAAPKTEGARARSRSWSKIAIRVFALFLIAVLMIVLARDWDWWVGSAVEQSTNNAYLEGRYHTFSRQKFGVRAECARTGLSDREGRGSLG